ncbi:pyridoxamine 5'-phosphate oxidase [Clostridium aceticum]|uniref:Pyridoxamine 5'-phosphate oxidase n=1 Tax=Clostridium aceticum TaxID=84022 RepID=A0A0D8IAG0_9CLOT|nr:pyridoxamine 5'-phosphate oxidase family protein [Clostridium aceticum]AKL96038.1 pyridoxamine 5'-phosphate oxidase [Clostridium aceticum]KJF27029.1 pyridoxamine 5-phosphate oxidase [Clostridium aceticum]
MNTKSEFERIMATQTEIALATSVNDMCNVRIVNFIYDETSQTLFFATFGDNDKVKEFEQNRNVAFTTVPHKGNEHVKAKAQVNKSNLSILDVKDSFISKIPGYEETINQAGQFLVLFEVKFNTAIVTLDFENIDIISLA